MNVRSACQHMGRENGRHPKDVCKSLCLSKGKSDIVYNSESEM